MGRHKSRGIRAHQVRPRFGGVGRDAPPRAERLSDELRLGASRSVVRRRRIAGLTLVSALAYGVVGAYQFGLAPAVPEPPLPLFDADRVDASGEAYAVLDTPDAALGLTSAGITLVLAGMSGERRRAERPWLTLLFTGKVAADAAGAAYLFAEQATRHRRLCSWCTLAAVANIAALPIALAEARAALGALRGRGARTARSGGE
ncbi:putative membrane protein [Spinactinospora alkalitolerans]|uniref:Putative membrane protein n=1 Tax=Spinactinospora alkalitolerans TaxID=687207 RepID=A0A852U2C2_9ACTN|nr:vitamin K epoxide reductase family protein [Spinactinospora alkalitolerans]NYE48120.1 putative membrane protein [Spinactinospora alkalitolerans]